MKSRLSRAAMIAAIALLCGTPLTSRADDGGILVTLAVWLGIGSTSATADATVATPPLPDGPGTCTPIGSC